MGVGRALIKGMIPLRDCLAMMNSDPFTIQEQGMSALRWLGESGLPPPWSPELGYEEERVAHNVTASAERYLADHIGSGAITSAQGEELREQIGATAYIECSSKTQQNIRAVFDTAIKVVLQPPRRKDMDRKKSHIRYLGGVD
ncbi:PREDICTED: rac-like GTP-binding protein 2 [Nelumbo nucifera]|uniref:Rac-like GTP-binding protein 2 n=1 Tax=Nelumbo nucifera TaxID=4432 RepID=A0A1U8BDI2_NELNU|nr:PREDICTED: rac-like GTP-binding protein 2 [Nelumbo nucifera]